MISPLDSMVRVSAVLGVALLAMPLLRGRSAVARRLVLSVAFAAVLVVPFLPAWHVDAPAYRALVGRLVAEPLPAATAATEVQAAPATAAVGAWATTSLALVWALGALAVGAHFAVGLLLARRLVQRSSAPGRGWEDALALAEQKTGIRAAVAVSSEVEAPAVTGIFMATVLVPRASESWSSARKLSVLLHELAHVAAHDLGVQTLAAVACTMHWFNPLAWIAARRLRLERELAADESVLRAGVRASSYAADLLAIAGGAPVGTIAMGNEPLPARIAAIVAERRPPALGARTTAGIILGGAAIAAGVACTTAVSPEPVAAAHSPAIDGELQAAAERELTQTVSQWKALGGTILVLSPKGDVLADVGGHSDDPTVAGSTMKAILLAAAIDEGVVAESDVFDCSVPRRDGIHDSMPSGRIALPEILAVSSNIGAAQVFDRLGGARYDRALRRFHFDAPPELATAPACDPRGALTAIGATMTATPRQVALAYAALADGGAGLVKADSAARVTKLLEGATTEHGTGWQAQVPGVRVAGKTGTSDFTATDGTKKTYASFVGYLPAERPRYVVFVGIDSPVGQAPWGGNVAAPVFSRIAARAMAR
ncbi:MAG: Cell division protein FtsI [Labilithrix sp.]|nr:Cell division protein FtsI [Labilithrix sp.]